MQEYASTDNTRPGPESMVPVFSVGLLETNYYGVP